MFEVTNCPCFCDSDCHENSLIRQKCIDNNKCLIKQVIKVTNQQSVLSLFEICEVEDD